MAETSSNKSLKTSISSLASATALLELCSNSRKIADDWPHDFFSGHDM